MGLDGLDGKLSIRDSFTESGGVNIGRVYETEVRPVFTVALCGGYGRLHEIVFLSRLSAKLEAHLGTKC